MGERRRYKKKGEHLVVAVRLDLDTAGFTYRKWGGEQHCKRGDWLVDTGRDTYTVDHATFTRTYREVERGRWSKVTPVWAEVAETAGSVSTKEGSTAYEVGDYLVFNEEGGGDPYAVSRATFESLYVPDD